MPETWSDAKLELELSPFAVVVDEIYSMLWAAFEPGDFWFSEDSLLAKAACAAISQTDRGLTAYLGA